MAVELLFGQIHYTSHVANNIYILFHRICGHVACEVKIDNKANPAKLSLIGVGMSLAKICEEIKDFAKKT